MWLKVVQVYSQIFKTIHRFKQLLLSLPSAFDTNDCHPGFSMNTIKKTSVLLLSMQLWVCCLPAQALTTQREFYTWADTLRGALRPERTCYDVTHYDLRVKVNPEEKSISGSNKITFKAKADFSMLQLDLFENMRIMFITSGNETLYYKRIHNAVFVTFRQQIKKDSIGELTVYYYGNPIAAKRAPWDGGFTWSQDKEGTPWIAVSCEGIGASLWWPCKDHLSDEPDSMMVSCNVPKGLRCIANGTESPPDIEEDGTTTYHWGINYPINNYNVTLNIGNYSEFNDEYTAEDGSKLKLDYYVMPYNLEKAKKQFEQVKPMLSCYEKYLGKYPFWNDGYALVETPYLGMEHQGAIAYGNKYLTGYLGRDFSKLHLDFDYIIIHETGHEWWGNSVSCNDIADMWIHEGFCTYSEAIYVECLYGYDTARAYINAKKGDIDNKKPIVGNYDVNEEGDGDMYSKGSLFLNTLRAIVDDDKLWWSTIKGMSDTVFKMKNIGYQDVVTYFNTRTGKNLTPVFEQYLKHPAIPVFEYSLKKISDTAYDFTYKWNTDVGNFEMPVIIDLSEEKNKRIACTNTNKTIRVQLQNESDLKVNDSAMYIDARRTIE